MKKLISFAALTSAFLISGCADNSPVSLVLSSNPIEATQTNIDNGKLLYDKNCQACHGTTGDGKGDLAKTLSTKPADLTQLTEMPDGVMAMRIATGGGDMPAWGDAVSNQELWQLVTYIRTLD